MAQKKSVNLLPEYLKTDKNTKFLSSVVDPLIQTPDIERIDGYIGSKLAPNYDPTKDFYLTSETTLKNNYNLGPALVLKNTNAEVTDVIAFDDLVNEIKVQGGHNTNLDKLFRSKFYSYDPLIDWDKFINYSEYFWLPTGPSAILFDNTSIDIFTLLIGQTSYTLPYVDPDTGDNIKLSNGMKLVFSETTTNSGVTIFADTEYIVEGVGSSINLVKFDLLEPNEKFLNVYNEKFDSDLFDEYPFDGDKKLPINPEYITINKASQDLNPWTRYNRWFHKNIIELTAKINNEIPVLMNDFKAVRPIVEFKPNLQLFNFGKTGIENVDLIDTSETDIFSKVNGSNGYYIDEVLVQEGHRIIFNNEKNLNVIGKIYRATFDYSGDSPVLNLVEDYTPSNLDCISINLGKVNSGKNYFYNTTTNKWIDGQQKTNLNQAPLFDLFNSENISYTQIADKNNFTGNKIFGYDTSKGTIDPVLGFPINSSNGLGIGGYKFKNYFMDGVITVTSNAISKKIPTGISYIKDNSNGVETFLNVWNSNIQNPQVPIVEIQTLTENTNTVYVKSIDSVGASTLVVDLFKKNVKIGNFVLTGTNVINVGTSLNVNDVLQLKILSDKTPNSYGYYEPPVSLSNNPLNGSISEITFSELSDHVSSMVSKLDNFIGTFPGPSNLRDIADYAKFGSRLVVNANPISFSKIFLGKKEHNLIDSIRSAANQYNQFKMALLNTAIQVSNELLPRDALDEILIRLNKSKNLNFPYYNSDMLGYGPNKTVRSFTVNDVLIDEYPTGKTFDITTLNYNSILVYLNGIQLVLGQDYEFSQLGDFVTITKSLLLNDVIDIIYYPNTLACYVPSTPSKLGMYPKFKPQLVEDTSYSSGPVWMILGHDGSLTKTYGNYSVGNEVIDYRDAILLEFEKRIFNNIKISYDKDIFDVNAVVPGSSRSTNYSKIEVNSILQRDYISWAGTYNVDVNINSSFDEGNYKTWNYKNAVDVFGNVVSGTWRGIFTYYYDTDRPDTHPWEMLGHNEKPLWWDDYYSWTPGSKRTALINAVVAGLTEEPPSATVDLNYAKPNFASIIPVDNLGNIKAPHTFLITENGYLDKIENWIFGDFSPAEIAWRRSSYYPFVLNCLSAILYPADYASSMFDLSRTKFNKNNQLTYLEDDLYLNPKKLILNDDSNITSGYLNYVIEKGKQKYPDYINKLTEDLSYFNFNLFYKVSGFTSKEKLQVIIDSIDPISRNSGTILPYEDYNLYYNVSNPIDIINISGIIVQKSAGKFLVKGYDRINPYFTIFNPIKNLASPTLTVGGVSESFVDYNDQSYSTNKKLSAQDTTTAKSVTSRYYKQGQIVRYNNQFYRVKVSHTPGKTFDSTLYQQLPSLPIKGGVTVQKSSKFQSTETIIPYGAEFNSIQAVYDFIIGYGAWLESKGFKFDIFNNDFNKIINWEFSAQEFLYWTTQNWSDGNLITLSPFANYLKFESISSIADDIFNADYDFNITKSDGSLYTKENLNFSRDGSICVIEPANNLDGIFFASIRTIQKEHSLIFNNTTIFNDVIYAIESGYKQSRIKLAGFKTKNWNGDYFSPGFVYDAVSIEDWKKFKSYLPNAVVRYNSNYYQAKSKVNGAQTFDFDYWVKLNEKPSAKLIPNFDYKINQFEDFYSLDVDNFDYGQQQLAQHLVGYTPRKYLNSIFTNPISQYKFYQGFIKEKGTRNSINKLDKAIIFNKQSSIQLNEEWAFRVGDYGGYSTYNEIEFNLEEGSYLENPYIIKLVDTKLTNENPLINYIKKDELLIQPNNYVTTTTFNVYASTFDDTNLELLTAGYVQLNDVTATAYNKNSILDIANVDNIKEGSVIWTGFLENGDWDVFRYARQDAKIVGVYVSAPAVDITFVTDTAHNLSVGELIAVKGFNDQVNGVYKVKGISKLTQFTVDSTLTTIIDEDLLSPGMLFKFESARYSDIDLLKNDSRIINLKNEDKFWIDRGVDEKWKVYQKLDNYDYRTYESINSYGGQRLGTSIYSEDNEGIVLFSAPGKWSQDSLSYGAVWVLDKTATGLEKKYEYSLNDTTATYCSQNLPSEFGYSLAYDNNKGYYFVGAPAASNVRASSVTGVVLSTGTGTVKAFSNEGLVKISIRKPGATQDITKAVIVHPDATTAINANYARFGHSLYINKVSADTTTTLIVSAPGDSLHTGTGKVFAYTISTASEITISAHPAGINLTSTSTIVLNTGSHWGYSISGDVSGKNIAISAPGYVSPTTGQRGVVQIFNQNLSWKQTLLPATNLDGNFGDTIEVSKSGKYLFVSSVNARPKSNSFGQVFVYKLNTASQYELHQTIDNPQSNTNLKFGYKVSINENEDTLAISALGTNISTIINFDVNQDSNTIFDQNTTRFYDVIPDAGTVHVYSKLGNYFVKSTELYDAEILEGSKFGSSLKVNNNTISVGAPSYTGVGVSYINILSDITVDVSTILSVEFTPPTNSFGSLPIASITYKNNNGVTKTVDTINIIEPGSGYLYPPTLTLKDSLGNTVSTNFVVYLVEDDSKIYQFTKIDQNINGFKLLREQVNTIDIEKIKRVALVDNFKEEIIDYIDIIDPVKGKISGIAEQELKYKLAADPAVYSVGTQGTINDADTSWIDDHVGELWWDLSTAKFLWYEQGDELFRKNNWGKLFPGATIDVYEWVRSNLLPSEWAAQADTNEGLTKGISGQPKYPDNTVLSVKQIYNNVTGAFENVYYYWVKNKTLVPNVKNRRISSLQVAAYIADPIANGLKFAAILSPDSIAFANVQPMLVGNRVNANIVIDDINNLIPRHTEWILLEEGDSKSMPPTLLEKKLIDSLLGHDYLGNTVPDSSLSYRNRYGLGIRPQQTLFKDRIEALRNIIEFANSVLIKNKITGIYSFDTLLKEEQIPAVTSGQYDQIVADLTELEFLNTDTFVKAQLECFVLNGKIRNVTILNPGYGYLQPPEIKILSDNTSAEITTVIDENGRIVDTIIKNAGSNFVVAPALDVRSHTVIVSNDSTANNKWTKNVFDYTSRTWKKLKTQAYNTPLYWNYVDWKDDSFIQYKTLNYVVSDLYELSTIENEIIVGDYVKVNNGGDGFYIILERIPDSQSSNFIKNYNLIYSENGTIQIKDTIWNFNLSQYSYDLLTLDETLYDQIPDLEIQYILEALKNDIFINDLKLNWNLLFFVAVKYAHTEQKLLDWAFKTSFVSLKNNIGTLSQKSIYKLDNDEYFEEYIKEVKPYRTKIRTSTVSYTNNEDSFVNVTDFDMPSYFNNETNNFEIVDFNNPLINEYPWKSWYNNYKYIVHEILVADGGAGYTQQPTVSIVSQTGDTGSGATAEAYLRNGKIYSIVVTNSGSNYTKTPYVVITGGGNNVTKVATASAVLKNGTSRKNIVGIKFDRYSLNSEINFEPAYDRFVCTGVTDQYELTWYANPYKETIIPKLDGKLIFSTDYTIIYSGGRIKKCKFKFLNYVPRQGQVFEITYEKNINIYNALGRIDQFYDPTPEMTGKEYSLLMKGYEYPNTIIQGLPFKYAVPWNLKSTAYDDFVWDELIDNYASAKLVVTATIGTSTLYLNSTAGIIPGQVINLVSTSTIKVRPDTIVTAVSSNTVTISNPTYNLKFIKALGTGTGSSVVVQTKKNFYGDIKKGDIAIISGVTSSGYNGQYTVAKIEANNTFLLTATNLLSTSTAILTTSAQVKISSILETINSNDILFDKFVNTVTNVTSTSTIIYHHPSSIVASKVFVDGIQTSSYTLSVADNNNTAITLYNLSTSTSTISAYFYTNPKLEFWNIKTSYVDTDTELDGGSWSGTNFVGAFGVNPSDIVVNGEKLLSQNVGYGPEELVNGHVLDSVGINVYTRTDVSNALVMTGAFFGSASFPSSHNVSFMPMAWAGIMVYADGQIFERINDLNFVKPNQYFIDGNTIVVSTQPSNRRIGYTIMTTGGENVLDSGIVTSTAESQATVESLANIDDVNSVYVLVNGEEINEVTTTTNYGYMLKTSSGYNNRACVVVYNLPAGTNTIEAWFLNSYYDYFNRVHEEYFTTTTPQSTFILSKPPADIEPSSSQAIVELGSNIPNSTRKRLLPPWVSYYTMTDSNLTFDIDDKYPKPSGYYSAGEIKVYANGIELTSGFDYTLDLVNNTVTITAGLLTDGDALAITALKDYEYVISGNILQLATPASNATLKVITFTDHDDLLIKTERFVQNGINRYILSRPVLNDNYIWVYVNGIPLIHRYDFEVLDDMHTIQFSEWIVTDSSDSIMITSVNDPVANNRILGFRVFKDMFDRLTYRRISEYHSTYLTTELNVTDTEIHVNDDNELITPDPVKNKPGVIIVDGERIEFFEKAGNVLRQLRRSTLGTGPATMSQVGTTVIDQSHQQTIPYKEDIYVQKFKTTTTNTYIISTATSTSTGAGITLTPNVNAVDQITVYYGGRQLNKSSVIVHDLDISYDPTEQSLSTYPPEFSVNTATQALILNLREVISAGVEITVVQKKGYVWTGTESLLTSEVKQAEFLNRKPAILPDIYYYGGPRELLDDSYNVITDDDGYPLEE